MQSIAYAFEVYFMRLERIRCNGQEHPIQVENRWPVFSWIIEVDDPTKESNIEQLAYRIVVKSGIELFWDSGKIFTCNSLEAVYDGRAFRQDTQYMWKLQVWVTGSNVPLVSENHIFETGLMGRWDAEWIGYDKLPSDMKPFDPNEPFYYADDFFKGKNNFWLPPASLLRKEFECHNTLANAKLYISAQGLIKVEINGKLISDERLIPGDANYEKQVWSNAYNVTEFLKAGMNVIGVILADGWYSGYTGLHNRECFGSHPRVMAELRMTYEDGTKAIVSSDGSWKAAHGPFVEADVFEGEYYNALLEKKGWSCSGYDDSYWDAVDIGSEHSYEPIGNVGVPIVVHNVFPATEIKKIGLGTFLVDLGQYISGVLRITIRASRNAKITIRHAEILDESGKLYLYANRSARAEDTYICKGIGVEIYEPSFTYHGFRYAEISCLGDVKLLKVEGVFFSSAIEEKTDFKSSSEIVNQIFQSAMRTMMCNMMDKITDVCARDERLGWGLETDHAAKEMTSYMNLEVFIRKWVEEIWSTQHEDGSVEPIAPPIMMKDVEPYIGDLQTNFGVRMVYVLYKEYGDIEIVRLYYSQMRRYLDFLENNSDRGIRFATTCDWLGLHEDTNHSDTDHGYGDCNPAIIGTTHYAMIVLMMAEMSKAICCNDDTQEYIKTYRDIKYTFQKHFVASDGSIRYGRQGDYVLAFASGLIEEKNREICSKILMKKLKEKSKVFWRGGTPSSPYFFQTLIMLGRKEIANQFLTQDCYPSLGYMIKTGPGVLWERWDGIWEENGKFHPQPMNAMCHIGFVPMAGYITRYLVGIRPLKPGYSKFEVWPHLTENIRQISCKQKTKSGEISTEWTMKEKRLSGNLTVPPNTRAVVIIETEKDEPIKAISGTGELIMGKSSVYDKRTSAYISRFDVGSGFYQFKFV